MTRTETLKGLHDYVSDAMGGDPFRTPDAIPACLASAFLLGASTPAQSYDYIQLFARVRARQDEQVDVDDLVCRLGVLLGISLLRLSPDAAEYFSDPRSHNRKWTIS